MSGFATARQKMVDGQVRPSDVTDIRILDAMLAVPREAFVPGNKQALAYLDLDLDVSEDTSAARFLIKPAVLAKMLQAAEIRETDRVLVVGCATGYAAAVIARFVGPQVTATEGDFGAGGQGKGPPGRRKSHRQDRGGGRWRPGGRSLRCHRSERRDRNRAGAAVWAIAGRWPAGRGVCDVAAATGDDRDLFPRRLRPPDAVRRRRPCVARHGTRSGLRFLAFRPLPRPIIARAGQLNPIRNQKCGPIAPRAEFRRGGLLG